MFASALANRRTSLQIAVTWQLLPFSRGFTRIALLHSERSKADGFPIAPYTPGRVRRSRRVQATSFEQPSPLFVMPPRSPPHSRTLIATTDDVSLSSNAIDPSFAAWTDGSVIDINDSLLSVSEQQATGASTSSTHYSGESRGVGVGVEGGADDSTASGSYAYRPGEGSRRSSSLDPPGTPAIDRVLTSPHCARAPLLTASPFHSRRSHRRRGRPGARK